MRPAFWLLGGALAVVVVAGIAAPSIRRLGLVDDGPAVPTYEVRRGRFVHRIVAEGNLRAARATQLGPPARSRGPMRIAWMAEDGSRVDEGDVVIRFDPTDMENDLREGQLERSKVESRIDAESVREEGEIANLDRDADIASMQLEHAREFQSKDPQIFSRVEIIESDIDEGLATQRRDFATEQRGIRSELSQVELDLLAIEKRQAEMKIGQAQEMLDKLEVRAPHDGIFVLKSVWGRKPEIGQVVFGGNTIAELPQLDEMEAEVYVLEADAGGLADGLPATLWLESDPQTRVKATIGQVAALAARRFRESPVQYFTVVLQFDRTALEEAKPGARVAATLELGDVDDALAVPRQAVFEVDGRTVAYVRRAGTFEPVAVQLGPAAPGRVVVESGLDDGDIVALHDPSRGAAAGATAAEEPAAPTSAPGVGG